MNRPLPGVVSRPSPTNNNDSTKDSPTPPVALPDEQPAIISIAAEPSPPQEPVVEAPTPAKETLVSIDAVPIVHSDGDDDDDSEIEFEMDAVADADPSPKREEDAVVPPLSIRQPSDSLREEPAPIPLPAEPPTSAAAPQAPSSRSASAAVTPKAQTPTAAQQSAPPTPPAAPMRSSAELPSTPKPQTPCTTPVASPAQPQEPSPARSPPPPPTFVEQRPASQRNPQPQPPSPSSPLPAAEIDELATSNAKKKIREHFLSLLSPQQYFGRVHRLHSIRTFKGAQERSSLGPVPQRLILVAKNQRTEFLYPFVRLTPQDAVVRDGRTETDCVLVEVDVVEMAFAERSSDVGMVFRETNANLCFVSTGSYVVPRDSGTVRLLGSVVVEWVPHDDDSQNLQCPHHRIPLELFDVESKDLVCALCNAKSAVPTSVVVLADLLTEANVRQFSQNITNRLYDHERYSAALVGQHQRLLEAASKQHNAIDQQFDLLMQSLEARRAACHSQVSSKFQSSASDLAKRILSCDETMQLLGTANYLLGSRKTLRTQQLATVAQALDTRDQVDSEPLQRGAVSLTESLPALHLENVMASIQKISVEPLASSSSSTLLDMSALSPSRRSSVASPLKRSAILSPTRSSKSLLNESSHSNYRSPVRGSPSAARRRLSSSNGAAAVGNSSKQSLTSPSKRGGGGSAAAAKPIVVSPGANQTCLFDFPLHSMLQQGGASCVQWALRIDEHDGDWIGVGVGVGKSLLSFSAAPTDDLSHLWIVPHRGPRTLLLKVQIANHGHVRLSVYDKKGHLLNEGPLAHWHVSRPAFPQITFGGGKGRVTMLSPPTPAH